MATREYSASSPSSGASIVGASSARPFTAWVTLLAAMLVGGCGTESSPPEDGLPPGEVGGELSVPPFLADSRTIDVGLLSVTMTVGRTATAEGTNVPVTQSGSTYTASFRLPDDAEYPVEVLWSYAATGRSTPIPVAEATSSVSLTRPSRTIRFAGYETSGFDFDMDGRDNLTEIDQGTDPLQNDSAAPVMPRSPDQGDCRMTMLPGEPADEASAPRDLFRFGNAPFAETRALQFDTVRHIYYATFFLETGGDILIEHRSGLPMNTNAILYDRRVDAVGFDGSAIVSVLANPGDTADGVPARIATRLPEPGLYCYALLDESADDIATGPVLTDIVLRVEFTPDSP